MSEDERAVGDMTTKDENNVALIQAYRLAVEAKQNDIADKLEDVILASMGVGGGGIVFREWPSITPTTVPLDSRNIVTCSGKDVRREVSCEA